MCQRLRVVETAKLLIISGTDKKKRKFNIEKADPKVGSILNSPPSGRRRVLDTIDFLVNPIRDTTDFLVSLIEKRRH